VNENSAALCGYFFRRLCGKKRKLALPPPPTRGFGMTGSLLDTVSAREVKREDDRNRHPPAGGQRIVPMAKP